MLETYKTQIVFSRRKILQLNKYAIQRYGIICQRLYDRGIISNPSVFNYMDFFSYLYDNYNEECKILTGNSSKMERNSLYIEYILGTLKNTYFKRLIHLYHDIIECEEMLDLCQNFTSKPNRQENEVTATYGFKKGLSIKCSINLENRSVRYLVNTRERTFNKYYLEALAERVKAGKDSVILASKEEDEKYFDLILTGQIKGETEYAKKVDYYLTNNVITKDDLFLDKREEILSEVERVKPLYLTSSGMYTAVKDKELKYPQYVGTYVHDYMDGSLSVMNCLNGYNGEFISEEDLYKKGFVAKGFPVMLYRNKRVREKFYPLFAVYTRNNLLYPLNPRYTFTHKKINPKKVIVGNKEEQKYCDDLRSLYMSNVSNKSVNGSEAYLHEIKSNLSEEQQTKVKKALRKVLERNNELQ